jgi:hypothetical protein
MADTLHVEASLRIDAPPELVAAQFRDIDHHIRDSVHPGIQYSWEPGAPGERKIRTAFRILGAPQHDIAVLEDAPDGSLVIRYLEGTNAGMVVVHRFDPVDGGKATNVVLLADAPATLVRKILGPLFVLGAKQIMRKALHEDKRDIEKGFLAGKAAGNVERALQGVETARVGGEGGARAILEAACFVTAVDGEVDDAEGDVVRRIAKKLGVDAAWVEDRRQVILRAAAEGSAERAKEIGEQLAARGVGQEGVIAAAVAALVSHGMSVGEIEALRAIAKGAGIADEYVAGVVERADAALTQG